MKKSNTFEVVMIVAGMLAGVYEIVSGALELRDLKKDSETPQLAETTD